MLRRIGILAFAMLAFALAGAAQAQDTWPQKITLVHGFGAGGNADSISRLLANALSEQLGVAVVVDPKPGAGGNIASDMVARAAPDGQTIVLFTGAHAVSAALYKKLKFDPIEDFQYVSLVGTFPLTVATRADSPIRDVATLIATAKQSPGKLTFSSVGFGSTQHLAGELLAQTAGIKLVHVPYRGGTQPLTDVLGGQIDLIVDTITVTGPAIRAGTLRGLGVTSATPWPSLPGVPPVADQLKGFEVKSWIGIAAPAKLPAPILQKLNDVLRKVVASAAVQERLDQLGVKAQSTSPTEMRDFVAAEIRRWKEVADQAGLQRIE